MNNCSYIHSIHLLYKSPDNTFSKRLNIKQPKSKDEYLTIFGFDKLEMVLVEDNTSLAVEVAVVVVQEEVLVI